jgi:hypothetical protein
MKPLQNTSFQVSSLLTPSLYVHSHKPREREEKGERREEKGERREEKREGGQAGERGERERGEERETALCCSLFFGRA